MNVLVVEPSIAPYEKEINGLDEMQAVVGGLTTALYPFEEKVEPRRPPGQELPNIGVSELTGEVSDFTGIYDCLTALPPLPVEQDHVPDTAKGCASFMEGRIVIKPGMSQVQTIKTLVHEIAHAKLHNPDFLSEEQKKAWRKKEVEAKSIAYVVCQNFDIDTSDYSFGYVVGWSRGQELAELKASLDVIHSTAGQIINAIQPPPPELERKAPEQSPQHRKSKKSMRK